VVWCNPVGPVRFAVTPGGPVMYTHTVECPGRTTVPIEVVS